MRCLVQLSILVCLEGACACSGSGGASPTIDRFDATPTSLPTGGGVVMLTWAATGATSLRLDPGAEALTPVSSGTQAVTIATSTTFMLTAAGGGSSVTRSTSVSVACDSSPGNLTGTCNNPSASQCVEFAGLSAADLTSLQNLCGSLGGTWLSAACDTTDRVGSCQFTPSGPTSGIHCSPAATAVERYYGPRYMASTAQQACAGAPGSTFIPG